MGVVETIALTMGVGWASGLNLYAAICTLGILMNVGYLEVPPDHTLAILQDPLVIAAAGAMYVVEFFADKVPGVDTAWDVVHTFIRIPAGAVLAAGAVGDLHPAAELAAAIAGGTLAAGAHATKAGTRALINTSPEPFSNWTASIMEDVMVIGGLWAALAHPVFFLVLLALFVLAAAWLLPRIWRGLVRVAGWVRRRLSGRPGYGDAPEGAPADGPPEPAALRRAGSADGAGDPGEADSAGGAPPPGAPSTPAG